MRDNLLLAITFLMFCLFLKSQDREKMAKESLVKGSIIIDDVKKNGFIKYYNEPWKMQNYVLFISEEKFEVLDNIKNNHYDKYSPKEIKGYNFYLDEEFFSYSSEEYADLSLTIPSLDAIPKTRFLRKFNYAEAILIYIYHKNPTVVGLISVATQYSVSAEILPHYIYKKGIDGKLKSIHLLDIKNEMADCQYVMDKYQNGDYGLLEEKETKISSFLEASINKNYELKFNAILDYNENCPAKENLSFYLKNLNQN